jgi:hypothetical protein
MDFSLTYTRLKLPHLTCLEEFPSKK